MRYESHLLTLFKLLFICVWIYFARGKEVSLQLLWKISLMTPGSHNLMTLDSHLFCKEMTHLACCPCHWKTNQSSRDVILKELSSSLHNQKYLGLLWQNKEHCWTVQSVKINTFKNWDLVKQISRKVSGNTIYTSPVRDKSLSLLMSSSS